MDELIKRQERNGTRGISCLELKGQNDENADKKLIILYTYYFITHFMIQKHLFFSNSLLGW